MSPRSPKTSRVCSPSRGAGRRWDQPPSMWNGGPGCRHHAGDGVLGLDDGPSSAEVGVAGHLGGALDRGDRPAGGLGLGHRVGPRSARRTRPSDRVDPVGRTGLGQSLGVSEDRRQLRIPDDSHHAGDPGRKRADHYGAIGSGTSRLGAVRIGERADAPPATSPVARMSVRYRRDRRDEVMAPLADPTWARRWDSVDVDAVSCCFGLHQRGHGRCGGQVAGLVLSQVATQGDRSSIPFPA